MAVVYLQPTPIDPARLCKGFGDDTLWILTEADRSITTFLLPEEYEPRSGGRSAKGGLFNSYTARLTNLVPYDIVIHHRSLYDVVA